MSLNIIWLAWLGFVSTAHASAPALAIGPSANHANPGLATFPGSAQPDILNAVANRWRYGKNNTRSDLQFARRGLNAEGFPLAEMHVALLPPIHEPMNTLASDTTSFPIFHTLVAMIDAVPRGGVIRVAIYMFYDVNIKEALVRALNRGARVRLITSDAFGISDNSLSSIGSLANLSRTERLALAARTELANAIKQANDGLSRFAVCANKAEPGFPGGCLSTHLMHHKFVTFSSICRFGLNPSGSCVNPGSNEPRSFKKVVFQSSQNWVYSQKHEMASVFFGRLDLYRTYVKQFNRSLEAVEKGPNQNLKITENHDLGAGSILSVNFAPRLRDPGNYRQTDLFLRELEGLVCVSGNKKTEIRVANTHWNGSVAREVITRLRELRRQGCVIKVLLPRDMNAAVSRSVSEGDAAIYRGLVATGAEVRTFAEAKANPGAGMHSKYVLVNRAAGTPILMFGTMSFTNTSQTENDEVWLVWKKPSSLAESFYRENFDRLFSALPQPATCGELDGDRNLPAGLVGYWKMNGLEETIAPHGANVEAVVGPAGTLKSEGVETRITAGALQQAIQLDGYKAYVTLPYEKELAPRRTLSLSLWVKATGSTGGKQSFVSKAQEGGYQFGLVDGKLAFYAFINDHYQRVLGDVPQLNDKRWHHAAAVFDGHTLKLFFDGSLIAEESAQGKIVYKFENRLCFGRGAQKENCSGGDFFQGAIDEVAVFDKALDEDEIWRLKNRQTCVRPSVIPLGTRTRE